MIMANGDTELKHLLTATLRLLPEHCKWMLLSHWVCAEDKGAA
jgi:hypothetical protein